MQYFSTYKKSIYMLVSVSLLSLPIQANENNSTEESYIDSMQKEISHKILKWADSLDLYIGSLLGDEGNSCKAPSSTPKAEVSRIEKLDAFFQNDRYLNETKDTYIRLRIRSKFSSRESTKVTPLLSARIPFDRCKKQWNLFFEDSTTNKGEIKKVDTTGGGIGINYFKKEKFGIQANYSLGLQDDYPFIRARYRLPITFESWRIEPVQTFKYSTKYYFQEESNIYFDKFINENNLFRIQLHRETASTLEGTDYGLKLQYFWDLKENGKFKFTQSFFGNTHYNDFYKLDKDYSGINNYVSSVSWRQSVWRDWFYYEITPSVNFHKDYDYEPSYYIRVSFDFYFGIYNK